MRAVSPSGRGVKRNLPLHSTRSASDTRAAWERNGPRLPRAWLTSSPLCPAAPAHEPLQGRAPHARAGARDPDAYSCLRCRAVPAGKNAADPLLSAAMLANLATARAAARGVPTGSPVARAPGGGRRSCVPTQIAFDGGGGERGGEGSPVAGPCPRPATAPSSCPTVPARRRGDARRPPRSAPARLKGQACRGAAMPQWGASATAPAWSGFEASAVIPLD